MKGKCQTCLVTQRVEEQILIQESTVSNETLQQLISRQKSSIA